MLQHTYLHCTNFWAPIFSLPQPSERFIKYAVISNPFKLVDIFSNSGRKDTWKERWCRLINYSLFGHKYNHNSYSGMFSKIWILKSAPWKIGRELLSSSILFEKEISFTMKTLYILRFRSFLSSDSFKEWNNTLPYTVLSRW